MFDVARRNGDKGINQTTLARATGIRREDINRICTGMFPPAASMRRASCG
jgi:predicted transcriptional regulator